MIDAGTANKEHYEVGDTVVISTGGTQHNYKLTGTVSFGEVDSLGFGSIAAWDVKTAQSCSTARAATTASRSRRSRARRRPSSSRPSSPSSPAT